jgi:hypothetical protein
MKFLLKILQFLEEKTIVSRQQIVLQLEAMLVSLTPERLLEAILIWTMQSIIISFFPRIPTPSLSAP